MKKLLLTSFAICVYINVFAQTTLVNYNFNSASSYPISPDASAGGITGSLTSTESFQTYSGVATGASAFTQNTTAGNAIAMANSSGTNTKNFILHLNGTAMNQYQGLLLYLQSQRSTTGATTITIAVSTDGTNYTNLGTTITVPTSFGESVISLTGISAAADVYIKLMASGASGTGTLRIDNLEIQGNQTQNAWLSSGTNIFYTTGNVGIGNTNPDRPLDVTGNARVSGTFSAGATTLSSLTTSGALSAGTLTVTGATTLSSVTASGTVTANQLTSTNNLSAPVILTSRILSLDSLIRFGDSTVIIPAAGVTKTNPLTTLPVTFDNIYSDKQRLAIGFSYAAATNAFAIGTNINNPTKAYGANSIAIGQAGTETNGTGSIALGFNVKTAQAANNSIVIGSGFGTTTGNALVNSTAQSLVVGFNSNLPTFFVGTSAGTNTTGKVGIGTITPDSKLTINATDIGGITIKTVDAADFGYNTYIATNRANTKALAIFNESVDVTNETFLVYGDGRTQIGYLTQTAGSHTDALLMVNGKAVAKSFYVTNLNWSDFVFDSDYKLMNPYEVENYYKKNHHLPGVPSAKEIKEKGNNLGETDAILLQKIEENTMYIVDITKKLEAQQKEIEKVKKQNTELKNEITKLKTK